MTREKIISLARECGINYDQATYPCINFKMFSEFYKLVQSEAFEAAATKCEEVFEWSDDAALDCADAIREMAKEMK